MAWNWRRRGNPNSVEDRYRAAGRLIAQRGFDPRGLTLIEVDGGFVVRGLRRESRNHFAVASDTISSEELRAELSHLRH